MADIALITRHDPIVLRIYAVKCTMHHHVHQLVAPPRYRDALINTFWSRLIADPRPRANGRRK